MLLFRAWMWMAESVRADNNSTWAAGDVLSEEH